MLSVQNNWRCWKCSRLKFNREENGACFSQTVARIITFYTMEAMGPMEIINYENSDEARHLPISIHLIPHKCSIITASRITVIIRSLLVHSWSRRLCEEIVIWVKRTMLCSASISIGGNYGEKSQTHRGALRNNILQGLKTWMEPAVTCLCVIQSNSL